MTGDLIKVSVRMFNQPFLCLIKVKFVLLKSFCLDLLCEGLIHHALLDKQEGKISTDVLQD